MSIKRIIRISWLLLLISFSVWYLGWFVLGQFRSQHVNGDFAEWVNNAFRFASGEQPSRDYWSLFPFAESFLPYLLLRIHYNIDILLFFNALITLGVFCCSFGIAYLICKNFTYSLCLAFVVLNSGISEWFIFLSLASAVFFMLYYNSKKTGYLLVFGIVSAISMMFRLYHAAPFIAAASAWLIFFSIKGKNYRPLLYYFIPILSAGVILIVYYRSYLIGATNELLFESILHNRAMALPYFYSIKNDLHQLQLLLDNRDQTPAFGIIYQTLKTAKDILAYLILPAGVITLIVIILNSKFRKTLPASFYFFAVWFILFLPYAWVRAESERVSQANTPLLFACLILITQIKVNHYIKRILITIAIMLALAGMISVYGARSTLYLQKYPVEFRNGTILFPDETEANAISHVNQIIEKETKPGDFIFVTAWKAPPLYFLTGRKNPTYYDSVIDLIVRSSEKNQHTVINDLTLKSPKIIILEEPLCFDYSGCFDESCPILNDFFLTHYHIVLGENGYRVYILNPL